MATRVSPTAGSENIMAASKATATPERFMEITPPARLGDLIWAPAAFTWTTGGQSSGFIPVRYPGTTLSKDDALLMGRRTDWTEEKDGYSFGIGQRILATDAADYALLEIRTLELKHG